MIASFIGGARAGSEEPVAVGERGRLGEHDVPVLGELAVFDAEEVIDRRPGPKIIWVTQRPAAGFPDGFILVRKI
jgi:hypothetical protein